MNPIRIFTLLCISLAALPRLEAQNIDSLCCRDIPDSLRDNSSSEYDNYSFEPKQLILPASLFAAGAAGTFIKPYKDLNIKIHDKVNHIRGNHKIHCDDYIQYLPTAAHLFLGFTRVAHQNSFLQRVAVDATSALSLAIMTNLVKYTFREKRPDSDARNSFPSGHTATAFMGAELMRIEYGPYWGIGGYCVATAVGVLRIYNDRHWLNDVIAGAGIGILSARIGYWLLPLYNKWWFRKTAADKKDSGSLSFSAFPEFDNYTRTFSINCILSF